jgi:hypothetical protein
VPTTDRALNPALTLGPGEARIARLKLEGGSCTSNGTMRCVALPAHRAFSSVGNRNCMIAFADHYAGLDRHPQVGLDYRNCSRCESSPASMLVAWERKEFGSARSNDVTARRPVRKMEISSSIIPLTPNSSPSAELYAPGRVLATRSSRKPSSTWGRK